MRYRTITILCMELSGVHRKTSISDLKNKNNYSIASKIPLLLFGVEKTKKNSAKISQK